MNAAAILARHRSWLERALPWMAAVLGVAAVLAGFLLKEAGPARRFVVFYVAPMVVIFPFWARIRLEHVERHPAGRIALDAAVTVLSMVRAVNGVLPFSGHMLFLTYTLLTTPSRWYRAAALVLLFGTTWFKLAEWNDFASWSIGLATGLASAGAYALLGRGRAAG